MGAAKKITPAKIVSAIALAWLASSFFYPVYAELGGSVVKLNGSPELYLIPAFAAWRLATEPDAYQRMRVKVMVGLFFLYWVFIPMFYPRMPLLDGTGAEFTLSVHMVGALPFFILFMMVVLVGKRADCGWNCPCVFSRETVGFAFRDATLKGDFWWRLRHLKWLPFAAVWAYFVYMLVDPAQAYERYGRTLYDLILVGYYASFLIIPFTGHRSFCRWACPWAATWGVLNVAGFYKIKADAGRCRECGLCEQNCDMGVPVRGLIREKGVLRTAECMGCGRCVNVCPQGVLSFHDVRDTIRGYNLGSRERLVRMAGGLTVAGLIFLNPHSPWGWVGLAFFATGLFGFCPTYIAVGAAARKARGIFFRQ